MRVSRKGTAKQTKHQISSRKFGSIRISSFQLTQDELELVRSRSQNATLKTRKPIGFIQSEDEEG